MRTWHAGTRVHASSEGLLLEVVVVVVLVVRVILVLLVVILGLAVDEVDGARLDALAELERALRGVVALCVPPLLRRGRLPPGALGLRGGAAHGHVARDDARRHEHRERAAEGHGLGRTGRWCRRLGGHRQRRRRCTGTPARAAGAAGARKAL